ncbi:hypothetical protein ACFL4D_02835 [Candidatus Margulisiibacteriota bacterium]
MQVGAIGNKLTGAVTNAKDYLSDLLGGDSKVGGQKNNIASSSQGSETPDDSMRLNIQKFVFGVGNTNSMC